MNCWNPMHIPQRSAVGWAWIPDENVLIAVCPDCYLVAVVDPEARVRTFLAQNAKKPPA